jgi:hypothetical protein
LCLISHLSGKTLLTLCCTTKQRLFLEAGSLVRVYADSGQIVFDATSKGNVLDWTVQDGTGERLRTGSYMCVVTVKSLNGKLGQRIGEVSVEEHGTDLRGLDLTHLTAAQQREIGPVEEDAAIFVMEENGGEASTILAHNGEEGRIIRGARSALVSAWRFLQRQGHGADAADGRRECGDRDNQSPGEA